MQATPRVVSRYLSAAVLVALLTGAAYVLWFLPRGTVDLNTSLSATTTGPASSVSSGASTATVSSNAATCNSGQSTSPGNFTFLVEPRSSFLSPGMSETLNFTVLAQGGLNGTYTVTGAPYFTYYPGDLRVSAVPGCISLAQGRAQVNVTVTASSKAPIGRGYVDLIVYGASGYMAHSYPVLIAPAVVQLLRGGFNPSTLNVQSGTQVIFFSLDSTQAHQLQVCQGSCGSQVPSPGIAPFRTWNYTFDAPGTYTVTDSAVPQATCSVASS